MTLKEFIKLSEYISKTTNDKTKSNLVLRTIENQEFHNVFLWGNECYIKHINDDKDFKYKKYKTLDKAKKYVDKWVLNRKD